MHCRNTILFVLVNKHSYNVYTMYTMDKLTSIGSEYSHITPSATPSFRPCSHHNAKGSANA